jgi:2-oxoisovalerate dehydrogenase E1 component
MGREGGVCGGIGGSQHLAFRGFHSNGVQAGMTAIGAGHGFALKRCGSGIVVAIIGDGTLGQGLVYEAMNLASIWELPMLIVLENNGIAQTTPTNSTIGGTIEGRAAAFGIPTWRLDDSSPNFLASVESVVSTIRSTMKPGFLVIDTKRMGPHSKGDDLRDQSELAFIRERDPLEAIGRILPDREREEIQFLAKEFMDSVCARAMAAPPAQALVARHSIFVLPPMDHPALPPSTGPRNVRTDLNHALRAMLQTSPKVILLGEDLHDPYGGAFKVTTGLSTEFSDRVISTPISEAGVVGAGIGLAMGGWLPVVEIMFADFVTLAFDQIYNHAVKFTGMFRDSTTPLVIRTPAGGRRGYGPTHSQSPEALLCAVPGLTVVFPSARHKPGELLWDSVFRWPYPTVFLEHKLLYGAVVDQRDYAVAESSEKDPGANVFPTLRGGDAEPDLTLVTYGAMVEYAETAAEELRKEELQVEIVVPSLLSPFPRYTLTGLLAQRERVVVIEETHLGCGFASELGTALLETGFQGHFGRVATPPVPIPAARSLELLVMPDGRRISEAILSVLDA